MIQLTPNSTAVPHTSEGPSAFLGTIAVVLPAFEGGGAQRDVVLLCNGLAAKGVSVAILVLRNEGPLKSLVDPAISIVEIAGRRMRYAIPGLRRALRELAPRLVLSSESHLNLCCLAAVHSMPRKRRPRIVLREVASPSAAARFDPFWQNRVAYRVLRRCYRYADRILTLTEGARRDLVENFSVPESQVFAMHSNAVLTPENLARIDEWDGERGREPDLIVSMGRLSPEKNHKLLIDALERLGAERPWRLAVVGDGPERAAIESIVREKNLDQRIKLVGFVSDPFEWMMRAGVVVCSSAYEGLCNALIEALGCGTPVVSTDCPYGPREILRGGRYGALVPPGDAAALALAIEEALDRPVDRAKLRERGLNYTAGRAAENFLELVADL